ncbi:hypothetical protein EJ04DRAFT_77536 [Polyplosphaeria fusca]|uniref:Uncharacterized protein n=1 Tax=Polyplosphaeria fusca TaxID=682080 RepID=A0A9P4QQK1_9PLEO|nr:hypothetical protein EJ04DRAFT_77536 [Polyplosphaeria fusca]
MAWLPSPIPQRELCRARLCAFASCARSRVPLAARIVSIGTRRTGWPHSQLHLDRSRTLNWKSARPITHQAARWIFSKCLLFPTTWLGCPVLVPARWLEGPARHVSRSSPRRSATEAFRTLRPAITIRRVRQMNGPTAAGCVVLARLWLPRPQVPQARGCGSTSWKSVLGVEGFNFLPRRTLQCG